MNKIKIVALFGPSSSGKDTLAKQLATYPNISEIISCTTRPQRDYEQDGVDYYFLTTNQFAEKVINGSMLEATTFRDWFYGTPLESLSPNMINVGVFNKQGIECLLQDSRLLVVPVLVTCEDKTRLLRSLERETNPDCEEICRRFLADLQDFEVIDFDYLTYYNGSNTDPSWIYSYLENHGILTNLN